MECRPWHLQGGMNTDFGKDLEVQKINVQIISFPAAKLDC